MRWRTVALLAGGAVVTALGVGAWTVLRVEDIPQQLEPVGDPRTIVIDGVGSQPPFAVAELGGKTVFVVWVGIQSWGTEEGRKVNRALNRWVLPDSTQGFVAFNAEGLGFLKEKSATYMEAFGKETRYPIYGDFEGQVRQVFKFPQGHHGLAVVGPEGDVLLRRSGGLQTDAEIDELRVVLGAEEPEPGPPVPSFALDAVDDSVCEAKPCVVLVLGRPVANSDVPGIDDGFDGDQEAGWEQMKKPHVRMAATALRWPLGDTARGVIVGDVTGLTLPDGWTVVPDAAPATEALGVEADTPTWLVLAGGRVAYRDEGAVPFYKLALYADAVGVEIDQD